MEFYLFFLFFRPAYIPIAITKITATPTPYPIRVTSSYITAWDYVHSNITARLCYNCPIRTKQIFDLRMCEDILIRV